MGLILLIALKNYFIILINKIIKIQPWKTNKRKKIKRIKNLEFIFTVQKQVTVTNIMTLALKFVILVSF